VRLSGLRVFYCRLAAKGGIFVPVENAKKSADNIDAKR
jgi:hypothetical protein